MTHADLVFTVIRTGGLEECRAHVQAYHRLAREQYGREVRVWTVANVVQAETEQAAEEFRETPTGASAMAEYVFLALRTTAGLSGPDFFQRFDRDFIDCYASVVAELYDLGWLTREKDGWRLTDQGLKLGNQAFLKFLP